MAKTELLPSVQKQWSKDLKALKKNEAAYWEYIATAASIIESKSYQGGGYASAEEFMESECGWKQNYGYKLIAGAKVRANLCTVVQSPPTKERHLRELAKVEDPKEQIQIFAEVSEKCEFEDREPTASDYRKAVKERIAPEHKPTVKPTVKVEDQFVQCPRCRGSGEVPATSVSGKIFRPPSITEVEAYCADRGNSIDASAWWDFYQSKNWMVGKNKMKDWQAAVRTWERKVGTAEIDAYLAKMGEK
jgi:hypothetical protein